MYSGDMLPSACEVYDLHASLIPLNRPFQAFGVSYEAHRDWGVFMISPEQCSAAQNGCYLTSLPHIFCALLHVRLGHSFWVVSQTTCAIGCSC